MNDALIQTGRTTRLVERAVCLAGRGRAVYIITNDVNVSRLRRQVDETWLRLWGARPHGIKVEKVAEFRDRIDWDKLTIRGAHHPNCEWLFDHYVIEMRIVQLHTQIQGCAEEIGKLYPHTV